CLLGLFFCSLSLTYLFFFFNDPATTEIYTLSLHDALPISAYADAVLKAKRKLFTLVNKNRGGPLFVRIHSNGHVEPLFLDNLTKDRKSTRLNSSHDQISYAVFCLKKKNSDHVLCTHASRLS